MMGEEKFIKMLSYQKRHEFLIKECKKNKIEF